MTLAPPAGLGGLIIMPCTPPPCSHREDSLHFRAEITRGKGIKEIIDAVVHVENRPRHMQCSVQSFRADRRAFLSALREQLDGHHDPLTQPTDVVRPGEE